MLHVFTSELITIGSDIGLFPAQHQIIVWTKSVLSQMNPMNKFHRRSIQNTKTFNMHFLENICHFVLVKSFWLIEWCNIIEVFSANLYSNIWSAKRIKSVPPQWTTKQNICAWSKVRLLMAYHLGSVSEGLLWEAGLRMVHSVYECDFHNTSQWRIISEWP